MNEYEVLLNALYFSNFQGNGTTLFTREQLYLPRNDFIYRLQQPHVDGK